MTVEEYQEARQKVLGNFDGGLQNASDQAAAKAIADAEAAAAKAKTDADTAVAKAKADAEAAAAKAKTDADAAVAKAKADVQAAVAKANADAEAEAAAEAKSPDFVAPAPKSNQHNHNANIYRKGYIWGKIDAPENNIGYYKVKLPLYFAQAYIRNSAHVSTHKRACAHAHTHVRIL